MGGRKRNKNRMQIDGKYFYKIKRLGEGAYGKVIKVRDENDEVFAVKKVTYNEREGVYADIIKEMDFLKRFKPHPHIIDLRGYKWDNQMFTVLMEFGGMPLHKFIDAYRYEYRMEVLPEMLWQLLSTLAYLHHHNMCHRDIKPDNILIEEIIHKTTLHQDSHDFDESDVSYSDIEINLKLCDFGLSKSLILKRNTPKTSTLWYRAPENLAQLKEYTTKIDIWAIGCVIYEYCTDEVLFEGNNSKDTLLKILRSLGPVSKEEHRMLKLDQYNIPKKLRKYPLIPLKDKQLENLMLRCLTINPDNRPTALDLLNDEYFTSKEHTITNIDDEILHIKLTDECYYFKPGFPAISKTEYNQNIRKDVLDWLFSMSVLDGTELKAHTIFLGIELFDRVMQLWDKSIEQVKELKYISIACLDISSKFLEIYPVDLELVYEYNNKQLYKKQRQDYDDDPSQFDRRPQAPKITREDMKEFVIKVNKYEKKILFLLNFVVLTDNPFLRNQEDFAKAKIEVYTRSI